MAKNDTPKYIFHALIVNKGVKAYSNLSVLCEKLKMKESPMKLSNRAKVQGGYPVRGWSNLAKSPVEISKLLIETRKTARDADYIKLEKHYDIDYLSPEDDKIVEITKKSLREI